MKARKLLGLLLLSFGLTVNVAVATPAGAVKVDPINEALSIYTSLDRVHRKEIFRLYTENVDIINKLIAAYKDHSHMTTFDLVLIKDAFTKASGKHQITIADLESLLQKVSAFIKTPAGKALIEVLNKRLQPEHREKLFMVLEWKDMSIATITKNAESMASLG